MTKSEMRYSFLAVDEHKRANGSKSPIDLDDLKNIPK